MSQELDPDLRALQEVRDAVLRAKAACKAIEHYGQAETDRLCAAMAAAAAEAAYDLGRLAVEETGIGRVHYKVLKNLFGSEGIWSSIKDEKTVGIIHRDEARGIVEVATPAGVIAGIVPTTNPTSTAMGKALIAVKGRNAIVISPHPRARRCIGETIEVLRRAIERAGGPPDLCISLSNPTVESTGALMRHRDTALILATGGSGLVHAAYSSGKPAYGVGPGNVPCYVDRSADLKKAAAGIVASQSFDNATLCCSEQGLILDRPIAERLLAAMQERGAHLCSPEETKLLEAHCNHAGHMNPDVVGKDPWIIAEGAGFAVPRNTSLLLAFQQGIGPGFPLSIEVLSPVLSVHLVDGWKQGCELSMQTLHFGGLGHTCVVWAEDKAVLEAWFLEKPASRIIVNGPSSEGAVGYSTWLVPSMSLGCGPQAGNITSDNITARHLINVKRVAFPRRDWPEIAARDHARAARWSGETAPRGSGYAGDPALAGRRAPAAPAAAWSAPAAVPSAQGLQPKVGSALKSSPPMAARAQAAAPAPRTAAPTFTREAAPQRVHAALAAPRAERAPALGVEVGQALSKDEIERIMSHAGAGCPLGPCRGCPHLEVKTGACTA